MIELPVPATRVDRVMGVICHGTFVLGIPVAGPVVVLLFAGLTGVMSPYIRQQAIQALVFQLVAMVIFSGLMGAAVMIGLQDVLEASLSGAPPPDGAVDALLAALIGLLFLLVVAIIACKALIRTLAGRPYSLPMLGRLGL